MFASLRPIPRDVATRLDGAPSLAARLIAQVRRRHAERRTAVHMHTLCDHVLADIGVARVEIDRFVQGRLERQ